MHANAPGTRQTEHTRLTQSVLVSLINRIRVITFSDICIVVAVLVGVVFSLVIVQVLYFQSSAEQLVRAVHPVQTHNIYIHIIHNVHTTLTYYLRNVDYNIYTPTLLLFFITQY